MRIALLLLLSILVARAATLTFTWDANAPNEGVLGYNVYEQVGTNWLKRTGSIIPSAVLTNVVPGVHVFALTATNSAAESDRSVPVTTPFIPNAPTNIVIKLSAVLQKALYPTGPWTDIAMTDIPAPPDEPGFFRIKMEVAMNGAPLIALPALPSPQFYPALPPPLPK